MAIASAAVVHSTSDTLGFTYTAHSVGTEEWSSLPWKVAGTGVRRNSWRVRGGGGSPS